MKPTRGCSSHDLFADLVAAHGEESGGIEDFYVVDDKTIGCRYGDCSIHLLGDGWHYGSNTPAHRSPLAAFNHRDRDYHISENAIAIASADPEPTILNMDKEPVSLKPREPPSWTSHPAPCYISGDPDWEGLKLALNEAIWTKAPPATTLEQAEEAACRAIGYLNQCFEANA